MDTTADGYLYAGVPMLLAILAWLADKGLTLFAVGIALLTYYRAQVRGAIISVRPTATGTVKTEGGNFDEGKPHSFSFRCRFTLFNEGPRAGTLEAFEPGTVSVSPRSPRERGFRLMSRRAARRS